MKCKCGLPVCSETCPKVRSKSSPVRYTSSLSRYSGKAPSQTAKRYIVGPPGDTGPAGPAGAPGSGTPYDPIILAYNASASSNYPRITNPVQGSILNLFNLSWPSLGLFETGGLTFNSSSAEVVVTGPRDQIYRVDATMIISIEPFISSLTNSDILYCESYLVTNSGSSSFGNVSFELTRAHPIQSVTTSGMYITEAVDDNFFFGMEIISTIPAAVTYLEFTSINLVTSFLGFN